MDKLIKYVLEKEASEMKTDPEKKLQLLLKLLTEFLKRNKNE